MVRTTVAIAGFSSDAGKTTLMCELLRSFTGWEAIKMTRGHYRSCGKDPHSCCVSHLLGDKPLIRSGRKDTYAPGKDTGRYWDAGASNVHWVIVTDKQVEQGINQALARVQAPGVFIEGNSFLKFVDVDFAVMVAPVDGAKVKPSARRVFEQSSALYLFENGGAADIPKTAHERFASWLEGFAEKDVIGALPVYTRDDLHSLVARIRSLNATTVA